MYEVEISPRAEEDLEDFDEGIRERFFKKLSKLRNAPTKHGKPLRNVLKGKWEIPFEGNWRIIYAVREEQELVEVIAILHKKDF